VVLGQGERGILELRFPYAGKYMFHAHVSEFAELGWMGFFEVTD
jgi:FtsP/CotA-like multicopper oxidase with cupredoxin domain